MRLADAVASRLRANGLAARTFTLKIRDGAFGTITRAVTIDGAVDAAAPILRATRPVLAAVDLSAGVRLLGLGASKFAPAAEQLRFDELLGASSAEPGVDPAATQAIDEVRQRFGDQAIAPASTVTGGRIRLVRRGTQQWGPDRVPKDPPDAR